MERGAFGEERYEREDMQRRVRDNFRAIMTPEWRILDASKSIEELAREVRAVADDTIAASADKPVGELWKWGQ